MPPEYILGQQEFSAGIPSQSQGHRAGRSQLMENVYEGTSWSGRFHLKTGQVARHPGGRGGGQEPGPKLRASDTQRGEFW